MFSNIIHSIYGHFNSLIWSKDRYCFTGYLHVVSLYHIAFHHNVKLLSVTTVSNTDRKPRRNLRRRKKKNQKSKFCLYLLYVLHSIMSFRREYYKNFKSVPIGNVMSVTILSACLIIELLALLLLELLLKSFKRIGGCKDGSLLSYLDRKIWGWWWLNFYLTYIPKTFTSNRNTRALGISGRTKSTYRTGGFDA